VEYSNIILTNKNRLSKLSKINWAKTKSLEKRKKTYRIELFLY